MTVALIERKLFGGTCVNTGCMPTKTLVASAYAAHLARRAADYGVISDGAVRVDMARVKARADAVTSNARRGVEESLRAMPGCRVLEGQARFESPDTVRVGDELLTAPRIFINVGGRAVVPDFPRLGEVPYLTNTIDPGTRPRAGPPGDRRRQLYRTRVRADLSPIRRGVTVVEKAARLIGREDADVSEAIKDILLREGIRCEPAPSA